MECRGLHAKLSDYRSFCFQFLAVVASRTKLASLSIFRMGLYNETALYIEQLKGVPILSR